MGMNDWMNEWQVKEKVINEWSKMIKSERQKTKENLKNKVIKMEITKRKFWKLKLNTNFDNFRWFLR